MKPIHEYAEGGGAVLGPAGRSCSRGSRVIILVPTLGLVDVEAERNAYGTQTDSFVAPADLDGRGLMNIGVRFHPRPVASRARGRASRSSRGVDGAPVLVREGTRFACTFHPELTDDLRVHALLLEVGRSAAAARES